MNAQKVTWFDADPDRPVGTVNVKPKSNPKPQIINGNHNAPGGWQPGCGWWTKCPGEAWKFSLRWEDAIRVALIWCQVGR